MSLLSRNEELLLLTIWQLQQDAYGVRIQESVSESTGYNWSIGAIYGPLRKLETKGLVATYVGDPLPERGGRGRVFYVLSDTGKAALIEVRRIHDKIWHASPSLTFSTLDRDNS